MDSHDGYQIPTTLYQAVLGKMMLDYIGRLHPTVIQQAMENRAVQTLEAIHSILENKRLTDRQCCERIDQLTELFFQELNMKIDRHSEYE